MQALAAWKVANNASGEETVRHFAPAIEGEDRRKLAASLRYHAKKLQSGDGPAPPRPAPVVVSMPRPDEVELSLEDLEPEAFHLRRIQRLEMDLRTARATGALRTVAALDKCLGDAFREYQGWQQAQPDTQFVDMRYDEQIAHMLARTQEPKARLDLVERLRKARAEAAEADLFPEDAGELAVWLQEKLADPEVMELLARMAG